MKRTYILKPTNDDWYPCYPENTVQLRYIGALKGGKFRVAAWGNDDFGLERDFDTEEEAISIFQRLEKYPLINHQHLRDLKFVNV